MRSVYIVKDTVLSPLGTGTADNFNAAAAGRSGVTEQKPQAGDATFYAALFTAAQWAQMQAGTTGFTPFEQLLAATLDNVLANTGIQLNCVDTKLIISSTKGNVSLLENNTADAALKERISLPHSAKKMAAYFNCAQVPLIISHACISGLVALITGKRLIEASRYENVVVVGADVITRFILSGFQSFHAVSGEPCRPFDAARNGINLGEAGAAIILSAQKPESGAAIALSGGAVSNDANHISGPSRTGQELFMALDNAMQQAGVTAPQVDYISAHGTATIYNDDMESRAIALAGMQQAPVNSVKGYFGHTLGAAGILEVALTAQAMRQGAILASAGYSQPGTVEAINVCREVVKKELDVCVKTASGFGGCNAAVVLKKDK